MPVQPKKILVPPPPPTVPMDAIASGPAPSNPFDSLFESQPQQSANPFDSLFESGGKPQSAPAAQAAQQVAQPAPKPVSKPKPVQPAPQATIAPPAPQAPAKPAQPQSVSQQAVNDFMAGLQSGWNNVAKGAQQVGNNVVNAAEHLPGGFGRMAHGIAEQVRQTGAEHKKFDIGTQAMAAAAAVPHGILQLGQDVYNAIPGQLMHGSIQIGATGAGGKPTRFDAKPVHVADQYANLPGVRVLAKNLPGTFGLASTAGGMAAPVGAGGKVVQGALKGLPAAAEAVIGGALGGAAYGYTGSAGQQYAQTGKVDQKTAVEDAVANAALGGVLGAGGHAVGSLKNGLLKKKPGETKPETPQPEMPTESTTPADKLVDKQPAVVPGRQGKRKDYGFGTPEVKAKLEAEDAAREAAEPTPQEPEAASKTNEAPTQLPTNAPEVHASSNPVEAAKDIKEFTNAVTEHFGNASDLPELMQAKEDAQLWLNKNVKNKANKEILETNLERTFQAHKDDLSNRQLIDESAPASRPPQAEPELPDYWKNLLTEHGIEPTHENAVKLSKGEIKLPQKEAGSTLPAETADTSPAEHATTPKPAEHQAPVEPPKNEIRSEQKAATPQITETKSEPATQPRSDRNVVWNGEKHYVAKDGSTYHVYEKAYDDEPVSTTRSAKQAIASAEKRDSGAFRGSHGRRTDLRKPLDVKLGEPESSSYQRALNKDSMAAPSAEVQQSARAIAKAKAEYDQARADYQQVEAAVRQAAGKPLLTGKVRKYSPEAEAIIADARRDPSIGPDQFGLEVNADRRAQGTPYKPKPGATKQTLESDLASAYRKMRAAEDNLKAVKQQHGPTILDRRGELPTNAVQAQHEGVNYNVKLTAKPKTELAGKLPEVKYAEGETEPAHNYKETQKLINDHPEIAEKLTKDGTMDVVTNMLKERGTGYVCN